MKLQLKILKILIAAICLALSAAGFAQGKITRKPKPHPTHVNSDNGKRKGQSEKHQPEKTAPATDNSSGSQPAPEPLPPGLPQSMASTYRQAKQGDIKSMKNLADHYHKQGNNEQYFYWLEQAGERGDADSYIALGDAYLYGNDCQKDLNKAEQYLTKAYYDLQSNKAKRLLGDARYEIASTREFKDENIKFKWYKSAADLGNADAQFTTGLYYSSGRIVTQDYKTAFEYFTQSANQGNKLAMYSLGMDYQYGEGTEKNLEKAEYWYRKAAEKGHTAAKNKLKEFKPTVVEIYDKKPGEGLIGCSVYHIRNGEKLEAWAADLDGRVTFKGLQPGDVLRFEYVGFKSKEVTIKRSSLPDKIRFTLNTGSNKKTDYETY